MKMAMIVNRFLRGVRGGYRASTVLFLIAMAPHLSSHQVVLRSDLVLVPVSVTDRRGQFVDGLRAKDFILYDDGQRRPIAFFSAETEAEHLSRPLAMILLLDASHSIAAILHEQQSAVASLLSVLGDRTMVSIVSFHQRPEVLLDFTADKDEALRAFLQRRRIGGNTAIFDALCFAIERLSAFPDADLRRVVVIISDGLDTASATDYRVCARAAQQEGIAVYPVWIPLYSPSGGRLKARRPTKGFIEVAKETGGKFFRVGTVKEALDPDAAVDLRPVFQAIINDLRHQYYLGFYPLRNARPGFHRVRVTVKRKGVRVDVRRRGYLVQ